MKRYAIVRVDNCPSKYEKGFNDYFVCDGRGKDMRLGMDKINCKKCRYGDTKEQLIRKIAQVIFKVKLARFRQVWKYECNEMEKKGRYIDSLVLARKIVEFLGVEE